MIRLFVGIPLDDATRAYVATAVDALKQGGFSARWVRPENWHITLAFLGDVEEATAPAIVSTFLSAVGAPAEASPAPKQLAGFSLRLSCIGAFPSSRRPRVIWVGDRDESIEFGAAAHALRAQFASIGFQFDDAARAHVTIARADRSAPLRAPQLVSAISLPVRRFVLFESVRGRAGVRYVEREAVTLA